MVNPFTASKDLHFIVKKHVIIREARKMGKNKNIILMWHGTSTKYYKDILDNGLEYSSKREDIKRDLSTNLSDAYKNAKNRAKNRSEYPLFVLCGVNPEQINAILDYDLLYNNVFVDLNETKEHLYKMIIEKFPFVNKKYLRLILEQSYIKEYHDWLNNYPVRLPSVGKEIKRKFSKEIANLVCSSIDNNRKYEASSIPIRLVVDSIKSFAIEDNLKESIILAVFNRMEQSRYTHNIKYGIKLFGSDELRIRRDMYTKIFVEAWKSDISPLERYTIQVD